MKGFVVRCVLFLLSVVALFVATYLLIKVRHHPFVVDAGINAVIMGDSHVQKAIDENGLDHVRNIAVTSEPYIGSYYKIRELIQYNPQVTTIFLGCSYHNFSSYYEDFIYGKNVYVFTDRFISVLDTVAYLGIAVKAPKSLLSTFRGLIPSSARPYIGNGALNDTGMRGLDLDAVRRRVNAQYYKDGRVRILSSYQEKAFLAILKLCKDYHRNLVLLNTPMSGSYLSQIPTPFVKYYDALVAANGLRVLDWADCAFLDDEFMPDGDHLNRKGAAKATAWFAAAIR